MVFGFSMALYLSLALFVFVHKDPSLCVCIVFSPCESLISFAIASKCAVNSISNQQCLCDLQWGWCGCGSCHCFSFFVVVVVFFVFQLLLLLLLLLLLFLLSLFSPIPTVLLGPFVWYGMRIVTYAVFSLSLSLSTPLLDVWHATILHSSSIHTL